MRYLLGPLGPIHKFYSLFSTKTQRDENNHDTWAEIIPMLEHK